MSENEKFVILHNIRSVYNVGSIFRTADGAGIHKIFCTGYTPTPIDRFGRKRADFKKVALGAEEYVSWERVEDVHRLITKLQQEGVRVVAVEQSPSATPLQEARFSSPTTFIFGNEKEGLPSTILDLVDQTVEIPMRGKKKSLNVAVSAGIVLYYAILN